VRGLWLFAILTGEIGRFLEKLRSRSKGIFTVRIRMHRRGCSCGIKREVFMIVKVEGPRRAQVKD